MDDRSLVDLIIARIPRLSPLERLLLGRQCPHEDRLDDLSKGDVEILFGRVVDFWNMDALRTQAKEDVAVARIRGIGYVSFMSPLYPPLVREIWDPPAILFYRGRLPKSEQPLIAVVGTRNPSPPALLQAYRIAKALAQENIPVVSGLCCPRD